jgi:hypothetical protein
LDMLLAIITFSALILTSSFPATSAADFWISTFLMAITRVTQKDQWRFFSNPYMNHEQTTCWSFCTGLSVAMCLPKIENRIHYGWDSHSYCWNSGVLCFFLRKPIHSYRILSTCSVLPNSHQSSASLQSTCFLAVVSICLLYHIIHEYARHVPISRNAK